MKCCEEKQLQQGWQGSQQITRASARGQLLLPRALPRQPCLEGLPGPSLGLLTFTNATWKPLSRESDAESRGCSHAAPPGELILSLLLLQSHLVLCTLGCFLHPPGLRHDSSGPASSGCPIHLHLWRPSCSHHTTPHPLTWSGWSSPDATLEHLWDWETPFLSNSNGPKA